MPDAAEPASLADGQSLAGGIAKLLRDEMAASHLKAVIVRVTRGNRVITTQAFGSSMPGVV